MNLKNKFYFILLLLAGLAPFAHAQENFLIRWDAFNRADAVEIEIQLTEAFRYVNHTSIESGEYIRIQMQPVDLQAALQPQGGANELRWTGVESIPLSFVESQAAGSGRILLVHFTEKTKILSVKSSDDNRSILIRVPVPAKMKAAEAPQKIQAPVQLPEVDTGIYAINLASANNPGILSEQDPALERDGKKLYLEKTRLNNKDWYRVRLGFFTSLKNAREYADLLRDRYADAWVSEVTNFERDLVLKGEKVADMSLVQVKPLEGYNLPPVTVQRLADLMEEAKNAIATDNFNRAILIYNRVLVYPVQPYQKNALEFAGLAHEKSGQLAQAKFSYQTYLNQYPEGIDANRVKQRLAGLETLSLMPRGRLGRKEKVEEDESLWDVYGSFGQYYRKDLSKINDNSREVNQSLITNLLDVNARKRTDTSDIQLRLTGSYDYDILDSKESEFRGSSIYFDYATRDQEHLLRLGRQTRSSGGVLGRFDGLYYGKKLKDIYRLNFVAGLPVESTADNLNKHKHFAGVSLDIAPADDDWNYTLFGIEQIVDGEIDRQAVGGEVRYFKDGRSLYGILDYDIYFDELNTLYVLGNWPLSEDTTLNFIGDMRKSPLLSLSSGLQGQTVTTIEELKKTLSVDQIKALALDRSATSKSATLGFSHTLNNDWQTTGDLTITTLSSTPDSGGVMATESTGPDYFLNLQILGANLLKPNDLLISTFRYSATDNYDTISLIFNNRYPVKKNFRLNPSIRIDLRENTNGTDQWTVAPVLRTTYIWERKTTLELELGGEYTEQELVTGGKDEIELLFLYAGYRHDF